VHWPKLLLHSPKPQRLRVNAQKSQLVSEGHLSWGSFSLLDAQGG